MLCPGASVAQWIIYSKLGNFTVRHFPLSTAQLNYKVPSSSNYRRNTFIAASIFMLVKKFSRRRSTLECVKNDYLAENRFKRLVNHARNRVSSSRLTRTSPTSGLSARLIYPSDFNVFNLITVFTFIFPILLCYSFRAPIILNIQARSESCLCFGVE